MTVIEFGKNDTHINGIIVVLSVAIVLSIGTGVVFYNNLVSLRHDIVLHQASIERMEVDSIEMKNTLYAIVDGTGKETMLQERGLVIDESPVYVQAPIEGHYISLY